MSAQTQRTFLIIQIGRCFKMDPFSGSEKMEKTVSHNVVLPCTRSRLTQNWRQPNQKKPSCNVSLSSPSVSSMVQLSSCRLNLYVLSISALKESSLSSFLPEASIFFELLSISTSKKHPLGGCPSSARGLSRVSSLYSPFSVLKKLGTAQLFPEPDHMREPVGIEFQCFTYVTFTFRWEFLFLFVACLFWVFALLCFFRFLRRRSRSLFWT